MKKITLLLLCLTVSLWSYGQCTSIGGGNYPAGLITVLNDGSVQTIATDNYGAGEYTALRGVISGNTYTVTGTNTTGIYITIAEIDWDNPALGGTVLGHGASSVSFTATTQDIIIHWHQDAACSELGTENTLTTIECTSVTCSCTETVAPAAVTLDAPANGAMNVPTNAGTSVGPFNWTDGTGGGTVESYTISLGTNPAGDDIGTIGFDNGNTVNFGWADGTTYFWSITAINCFGSAQSAIFSFTTEVCNETAVPACTTEISPMDGDLSATTGSGLSVTFEWAETAGVSYELIINTISQGTRTSPTTFTGFAYDTAYTWQVVPFNCFGSATGCTTWNFTTQSLNDDCANAAALTLGLEVNDDTSIATASGVAPGSCGPNGSNQDLWYSFVAPVSTQIDVATDSDHIVIYDSCGGTEVDCVANGATVNGLTAGSTYYVRVYNNGMAKVAGSITLTITESTLSTTDFDSVSLFNYYPNPVENMLNLNAEKSISNVIVYNMLGQEVINVTPKSLSSEIDLTNVKSGAYFVKVTIENKTETVRIIKN